jgi:hypothetical protein
MTYTLLEAGEKATSPPIIATQGVVKSDMALYAGGITWVDEDYDEKLGAALRPLEQDFRGFNYGVEMNQDTRSMLHRAFFLDALTPCRKAARRRPPTRWASACRSTSATRCRSSSRWSRSTTRRCATRRSS